MNFAAQKQGSAAQHLRSQYRQDSVLAGVRLGGSKPS